MRLIFRILAGLLILSPLALFVGLSTALSNEAGISHPVDEEVAPRVTPAKVIPAEEGVTSVNSTEFVPEYVEPQQTKALPGFPDEDQLRLIGRLADGIYKWKVRPRTVEGRDGTPDEVVAGAPFYFCGKRMDLVEAKELSALIAYHIVKASWEVSSGDHPVNVWGVAGTMANESSFDLCAFGLYPRKEAYKTKDSRGRPILKPSRLTVSHTREEVINAITHPKLKKKFRAFDLGLLQVLDLYYKGKSEDLLTWEGFYWQVAHMEQRQRRHRTKRPWAYWPGSHSQRYDNKVTRLARRLGATSTEI